MRVPTRTVHETMQQSLRDNYAKLTDTQRQLATGKRLSKVSDGPSDAINATRLRNTEKFENAYVTAADDGLAMLAAQDSALQNTSTILGRIKELMVAASSDIESGNGRQAIAAEISGLRDQLVTLANTTYDGRSVFGGFAPQAVQDTGGGVVSWVGDGSAVDRRVAAELTVTVNSDGFSVFGFGAGGDNLFGLLGRTVANVNSGDTASIRADLEVLEARHSDVTNALGSIGGRFNQIDRSRDTALVTADELRESRSKLEDVDMGAAIVDFKDAEAAYEATLAVIARMQKASLLDFLR